MFWVGLGVGVVSTLVVCTGIVVFAARNWNPFPV